MTEKEIKERLEQGAAPARKGRCVMYHCNRWIVSSVLGLIVLGGSLGCTHQKVRISQASDPQLSCAALRNELARVEQARAEIESKTGFSGRNVGMALVFWPGIIVNESQASSALAATTARIDRLNQLYYEKGCLEQDQNRVHRR